MIFYHMQNAEYHAHPAISKSGLDLIDRSPSHYIAGKSEPRKETPALTYGRRCHTAILESDAFDSRYAVAPSGIDRKTKIGKEAWEAFTAETAGREIITAEDLEKLAYIRASIIAHPVAEELLDPGSGRSEVSVFSEMSGVAVKCRPDWLRDDGIVVDLKTTENAGPGAFSKSCASYRYHVQSAFYADILSSVGIEPKAFVFVAVEKQAPYAVGVYELDAESIELGRIAYQRNIETYAACLKSGRWPAYSDGIETLSLPRWAFVQ